MAEPTDTATVERTAAFPVPPDVLWDALTDPDLLAEWFGNVDFDLEPGGAITDGDTLGDAGEPATIGVVETIEPPRRVGFVWIAPGSDTPSSVELEIDDDVDSDDGCGSILRVREVRIEPRWEPRPDWFTPAPRACAGAGPRA
ncbi:MAG TPA: SRPBCC domain-containing protein [Acidimicrobiia bacterium]|jgi:uncharacterized protein YndB with AHSA1/START domain|nr:SRPBCC domain-containing protein [Acidimicrobiia bacterium]